MQFTIEDISSVKKTIHIEIPEEEISGEMEKAFTNLQRTASLKGFRPGKAPRAMIESMYMEDAKAEVAGKVIQRTLLEVLKESKIDFLGSPRVIPAQIELNKPYKFSAEIEIRPEIPEIPYKGLELTKTVYEVKSEEIQSQLEMLQKSLTELTPILLIRPLQKGDYAVLDYEGLRDGLPHSSLQKTQNFTMRVGDGHINPKFDEDLLGMNIGDTRSIRVTFPQDHPDPKLADMDIDFIVTLNGIREETVPLMDDAFAKKIGNYNSLEDLKKAISESLTQGYSRRQEQELHEQIFNTLVDRVKFEVPDILVEYELDGIISEASRSFAYQNISLDSMGITRDKLVLRYRDTAVRQVQTHLLLAKLIEQENLTLTDKETEAGYLEMSATMNQSVDNIKKFYEQNPDRVETFRFMLLEKKAHRLILENSKITEVPPLSADVNKKADGADST